jgi:hypothetical protein
MMYHAWQNWWVVEGGREFLTLRVKRKVCSAEQSESLITVFSPTDAQDDCFKSSITIYIKTAPTCFGVITIIRERTV